VAVAAQVANGGRGMPSFAGRFSATEIESLAVYVSSVAGTRPVSAVKLAPASATKPSSAQSSAAVRIIQVRLQQLGFFAGPVTGFYGPLTIAAVKRFQAAAGLTADGVWGAAAAAALARRNPTVPAQALTPPPVGVLPLTTASVRQLQKDLAALGLFHGPETGYYGPETTAAVKLFQASVGLSADGQWGPSSDAALVRRLAAAR